jgi:CheY-like chemotaxis protein
MSNTSSSGKTVLVADDSAAQRRFLEILFGLDGHTVVGFEDGLEALTYIQSNSPDLIVMDVNMPYMTGLEVCQSIKGEATLRNIPIIILTSLDDSITEEMALLAQADAFIKKPLIGKGFRMLANELLGYGLSVSP